MNNKKEVQALCRKYTGYSDRQINIIVDKAKALSELTEIFDCDIFIDVPLVNSTASIVVYHASPVSNNSIYEKSPVGQLALKRNEPGVWKVSRTGGKLKGYKAFNQEDVFIRQDIYSIKDNQQVLGTCVFEKSLQDSSPHKIAEENDY